MKSRATILALCLLATCIASFPAIGQSSPPQPWDGVKEIGWGKEAAKYLDERMDLWFAKAKKLRTGEAKTSCISCHTAVPYALARPALRQMAGADQPTPQETRLLAETIQRVETY